MDPRTGTTTSLGLISRGRRALGLACLLCLVALGLAGCGNDPYPAGETAKNAAYIVLGDDPKSLDPSYTYTVDEGYITDLIYPCFYRYHYLKRDPFVLQLNLGAEEPRREPYAYTDKGPDGKPVTVHGEQYTFRFRSDVTFPDDPCFPGGKGRHIVANDVLYSFKRMCDPKVQCPVASYFADKVVGWQEYSDAFAKLGKKNYDNPLPGVQVDPKDPQTLHIYLSKPYPQLLYLMAMHFTTPQAREAVEYWGDDYKVHHPVGSGLYQMAYYREKQRIVLQARSDKWPSFYPTEGAPGDREAGLLEDAGKQLPLNDEVIFPILKEGTTIWNLFLQGYLDRAGVNPQNFQQVFNGAGLSPELKRRGVSLRKSVQLDDTYCAFNMDDPVWGGYTPQKRKLRQAVSLSIDSKSFVDIFNLGNGTLGQFLLPPGVFGYEPDYRNPYTQYDPNLTKAKQLLAEAGYPNGIESATGQPLVLNIDSAAGNNQGRQRVLLLRDQIQKLGIHVSLRFTRYSAWQDIVDKGQYQFIPLYGWYADYPDPENFLFLLYGPNKRPGPNACAYHNPEYDRLFEQMQKMPNSPERLEIIRKMRAIAVEDCPWIVMWHDEGYGLLQPWMHNVKAHPIANDFSTYVRVDAEQRVRSEQEWNRPNYVPLFVIAFLLIGGAIPAMGVVRKRTNRKVRRRVSAEGEGNPN